MKRSVLDLLTEFADRLQATQAGREVAGAFDAAIQFRWITSPTDARDMEWFGGEDGSWACLELQNGGATVTAGDHRDRHEWRLAPLVETDEETLVEVLSGRLRPLEALLADRLHVSHFTVGGASGQWVLALLAFGQRPDGGANGMLPGRPSKRFMTYPYYRHVEERRASLASKIGASAS